jgi:penicillin-binding protein 2
LGRRLGITRILEGSTRLGFGSRTAIDLLHEEPLHILFDVSYYKALYGANWVAAPEELNLSIGQGAADQTIINMARFYSALAYDGYAPTPQLIRGRPPERKKIFTLAPEQIEGVREALQLVVATGTAAGSRLSWLQVAGKTGTAQNDKGRGAPHAWFVGYAPADKPTLLVAVLIEHGEHGTFAASLAQRIFAFHFRDHQVRLRESGG